MKENAYVRNAGPGAGAQYHPAAAASPWSLFTDDLAHWLRIWHGPDRSASTLEKIKLVWTHQPLQATILFRLSQFFDRRQIPLMPGLFRRANITVNGLDIPSGVPIGGGLYMPHTVGTVIMARRIGRNVTLISNITIGMRDTPAFPIIGDDVFVGVGARILGDITIGDGAQIGANAVVLQDVPPGATAVGIPARIISPEQKE